MNERQPYEKLIAEKLQQLQGPDVDRSWQQMKRLLDDDQQPKGGGGKRGPGGWWRAGLVVIVLIGGLLFFIQSNTPSHNELASVNTNKNTNASVKVDNNKQNNSVSDKSTLNAGNTNKNTNEEVKENTDKRGKEKVNENEGTDANTNAITSSAVNTSAKNVNTTAAGKLNKAIKAENDPVNAEKVTTVNSSIVSHKNANDKLMVSRSNKISAEETGVHDAKTKGVSIKTDNKKTNQAATFYDKTSKESFSAVAGANRSINRSDKHSLVKGNRKDIKNNNLQRDNGTNESIAVTKTAKGEKAGGKTSTGEYLVAAPVKENNTEKYSAPWDISVFTTPPHTINTSSIIDNGIAANRDASNMISKEAKDLARRNKNEAEAAKRKKSLNLNLADVFQPFSLKSDGNPWWAVGLSLNSSLTVGDQSRYNYNVNAKSGTLTDYLPSPYVQYHMNDNVYLQTELNLSAPQHVPQLLVSRYTQTTSTTQLQTSVYIQKLYYFNWPFSLHYSPVKNLYLAGGLQFSSLQSGIAMKEQRDVSSTLPGNPSSFVYKFKDDTTAAKLTPNEWRWETGADYYWNRFTLGFRYNKSFKDLVNLNVSSNLPLTINRNSSFLLFMKYNLFEGRDKQNSNQPRSLVRF